jgi:hypothetical protein
VAPAAVPARKVRRETGCGLCEGFIAMASSVIVAAASGEAGSVHADGRKSRRRPGECQRERKTMTSAS